MKYHITNKQGLKFIEISNNDHFEVVLCDLGASIYSIRFDKKYMNMFPLDIKDFKKGNFYHGKTIGPVGNRIEDATFEINGKEYVTEANEGFNSLHSGSEGWSNKIFNFEVKENNDSIKVIFKYSAKDMEGGFPGKRNATITYVIKEDNTIELKLEAISNKDTLFGLTNHAYFCLGSDTLFDLSLMINADKFLHPNTGDLIIEEIRKVNKIMDFRNSKPIMEDIADSYLINSKTYGYDHHFIFSKVITDKPQITLENSNYLMNIYTDFSGNQIYTDNYPDKEKTSWSSSDKITNRSIAIEPQESYFPRKIYKANEKFSHFITYEFKRK